MKYLLYIPDISCNHCKMRISKKLEELGVNSYQISVETKTVFVETDQVQKVAHELSKIDYPVERYEIVEG